VVSNGTEAVTCCGELGSAVDKCSVPVVKASGLNAGPFPVSAFVSSTITDTVLPPGDGGTLVVLRGVRVEGSAAVRCIDRGDTDSNERSVSSMVVLSVATDVSALGAACRAIIVLRSASTAASLMLDGFAIGKHDLRELAVDVRPLRVRIIDPVVISSPKPSS